MHIKMCMIRVLKQQQVNKGYEQQLFVYVGFFLGWAALPLHSAGGHCRKATRSRKTLTSFSLSVTISSKSIDPLYVSFSILSLCHQ